MAASTTVLTVTFDQSVTLTGVPAYTTDLPAPAPVTAAMTSPTTLQVTFDATIATATSVTIPYEDAAVRNPVGGFVQPYDAFAIA